MSLRWRREGLLYQSQHLGDLENLTGLEFFRESLEHLMRTFEIEPKTVVHDLHPGYLSTAVGEGVGAGSADCRSSRVQHHHAHMAACMAEHGLEGPVIGLALDGTGYGTDGKIWGGEVLVSRLDGFERFAHLDYVPMPGGEAAIREPWRMALGALHAAGVDVDAGRGAEVDGRDGAGGARAARMIERGMNTPLTSSWAGCSMPWPRWCWVAGRWTTRRRRRSSWKESRSMSRIDLDAGYHDGVAGGELAVRVSRGILHCADVEGSDGRMFGVARARRALRRVFMPVWPLPSFLRR